MAIPREKTNLEYELNYGIDFKNRRIHFGLPIDSVTVTESSLLGDVNQASIDLIVRAIHRMEHDHPKKSIEIHMNSYGGDVYSMLYLVDVILSSTCQFKFFGGGAIMSAATWIMAVCDERYLYPHTTVMVHHGQDSFDGTFSDFNIYHGEYNRIVDVFYEIYTENSRMPKSFWKTFCSRDGYLTAQEAIQLGLADFIVEYKKRGNLRKKRNNLFSKKINGRSMKALINRLYKRIGATITTAEIEIKLPPLDEKDPNIIVDTTTDISQDTEIIEKNIETTPTTPIISPSKDLSIDPLVKPERKDKTSKKQSKRNSK